ncbi:hypothetical protein [Acinetobacter sp. WZC-1]|uniref:hypothetical protein n=1 Tax=Acinetobacter sp. WZC-1 TaxID=3459034 RepID=UPI00403D6D70
MKKQHAFLASFEIHHIRQIEYLNLFKDKDNQNSIISDHLKRLSHELQDTFTIFQYFFINNGEGRPCEQEAVDVPYCFLNGSGFDDEIIK